MSFFSGIVDGRDHIRLGGYPGAFRELLSAAFRHAGGVRIDHAPAC